MKIRYLTLLALTLLTVGCEPHPSNFSGNIRQSQPLQTLKCGYALWPKLIEIDPKSGQLTGIIYEYVTELGKLLNIKIEWAHEVQYGDITTAFRTGKIDAHCSGLWPLSSRVKHMSFTQPIAYTPIYAYGTASISLLEKDLLKLNSKRYTIATIDGEASQHIATQKFPGANHYTLPKLADGPMLLLNIASKKADLTFTNPTTAKRFTEKSPGVIKQLSTEPLAVFGLTIAVPKGHHELVESIDVATRELQNSLILRKIIEKHQDFPGEFLFPHKQFEQIGS